VSAATQNELDRLYWERDKAREERDALAAHVAAVVEWADSYVGTTGLYEAVEAAREAPTTSLARLKATARAEAMEWAAEKAAPSVAPWLKALARDYRRQAEGGE